MPSIATEAPDLQAPGQRRAVTLPGLDRPPKHGGPAALHSSTAVPFPRDTARPAGATTSQFVPAILSSGSTVPFSGAAIVLASDGLPPVDIAH